MNSADKAQDIDKEIYEEAVKILKELSKEKNKAESLRNRIITNKLKWFFISGITFSIAMFLFSFYSLEKNIEYIRNSDSIIEESALIEKRQERKYIYISGGILSTITIFSVVKALVLLQTEQNLSKKISKANDVADKLYSQIAN